VRKDLSRPAVVSGTRSTAGRDTVLTAPEIMAALEQTAPAKARKQANKRDRDQRAADKKI